MAPPDTSSKPTKADLEKEARDLGIEGISDKTKDELAAAVADARANPAPELEDDGSDDSGRPPLRQVAQDSADPAKKPRVRDITTPKEGDR